MKSKLLFLFIFITIISFAQRPVLSEDFSFSMGEKYKRIKSQNAYYFASGKNAIAIKKGFKDMTIQRFSLEDLKEDVKKRQVIEDKGDFLTAIQLDDKIAILYAVKNKVYAQRISLTSPSIERPVLVLTSIGSVANDFSFKSTFGFDAGGRINQFAFKKSFDGQRLLAIYKLKSEEAGRDNIVIQVMSLGFNTQWKQKLTLPYDSEISRNEDFAIDSDGNFYFTMSIFSGEDADKKDKLKSNYRTEVFKVKKHTDQIVKSKINLKGKSVVDGVIQQDKSGNAIVAGFYANNDQKELTTGIFKASIDGEENAKVIQLGIPEETIQQYAIKREEHINEGVQKKKDKLDLEDLRVNKVIANTDGSLVIFGEQRYVDVFTRSSSSGSKTTYTHYYRDIFGFKIGTDNTLAWMHKLPKSQVGSRGKASMSYTYFGNNGKHYLFYIDDFENLNREFEEYPTRYFDGKKEFLYLTSYTIEDASGQVIKEPILTGMNIRNANLADLEISKMVFLPNKDMVLEAFDGKKNNLMIKISPN